MTFKVKDLMINISAGRGGTMLPADDGPIPPTLTPHTPVISAAIAASQLRMVAPVIQDALKGHGADTLLRAADGDPDGNPAVRDVLRNLDRLAVGGAVVAYGGSTAMPDPNCGGTSFETIPPTLTPIVHDLSLVISRSQLPAIKRHLEATLLAVEKAEFDLTPRGRDAETLRAQLESAAAELRSTGKS